MKKFSLFITLILLLLVAVGQIPNNYYSTADGKKQQELRITLSEIIANNYIQRTYSNLWTDFYSTDARMDGTVWDIYSNCTFSFGVDQDKGEAAPTECIKYNREHSIPNSWFGGAQYPMYTDLFHLYPVDKFVNAERADYPYGETDNPVRTYGNGGKRGNGKISSNYTGMIFEPADEFKGDLARTCFYMATRYININFTQNPQGAVIYKYDNSNCDLTDYAINLFLKWHRNDPVSEKEVNRNNAVFDIQKNRNPFIDYPLLIEHIWGNLQDIGWKYDVEVSENTAKSSVIITKYPNGIFVENAPPQCAVEFFSMMGQQVYSAINNAQFISLEHLHTGIYIVRIGEYSEKIFIDNNSK